jgi:hypothetical protein
MQGTEPDSGLEARGAGWGVIGLRRKPIICDTSIIAIYEVEK